MLWKLIAGSAVALFVSGCATYDYAQNVKMVAFSDNIEKGASMGNVRGDDCQFLILGIPTGPTPTVERAVRHTQDQKDGATIRGNESSGKGQIRYLTNMSTKNDGYDAVLFAKHCIVVTGMAYR